MSLTRGYIAYRIFIDILSALEAIFLVYKIVYSISVIRIIRKGRTILDTIGILSRISLTSKRF